MKTCTATKTLFTLVLFGPVLMDPATNVLLDVTVRNKPNVLTALFSWPATMIERYLSFMLHPLSTQSYTLSEPSQISSLVHDVRTQRINELDCNDTEPILTDLATRFSETSMCLQVFLE